MRQAVNLIRQLLDQSTDEDRAEWQGHAQTILKAVSASHPTRRGMQTAIAAAFFESVALAKIQNHGWTGLVSRSPKGAFSFTLADTGNTAHLLISTLQVQAGKPRHAQHETGRLYLAQLPDKVFPRPNRQRTASDSSRRVEVFHRAFAFDDFDILAVSMQPVTHSWDDFRYTLSGALTPRKGMPSVLARTQTVPANDSPLWTSDLLTCLRWHIAGTGSPGDVPKATTPIDRHRQD